MAATSLCCSSDERNLDKCCTCNLQVIPGKCLLCFFNQYFGFILLLLLDLLLFLHLFKGGLFLRNLFRVILSMVLISDNRVSASGEGSRAEESCRQFSAIFKPARSAWHAGHAQGVLRKVHRDFFLIAIRVPSVVQDWVIPG